MKLPYKLLIIFCLFFNAIHIHSQCIDIRATPLQDAFINAQNEYVITAASAQQVGAFWGRSSLNLNEAFDFEFRIFLGDNNGGADGVAFVLRALGTPEFGQRGGGLGYETIPSSLAIEFDTFRNSNQGDITNDHTAIQINGIANHNDTNANLFGPRDLGDIEDNTFHNVQFTWDPTINQFSYFFDGALLITLNRDIRTDIGSSQVLWGFTGSTGSLFNEQKICALTNIEPLDLDSDNDGITDLDECGGAFPCSDIDGDGIDNHLDLDSDGDGCFDTIEAGFTDPDNDGSLGSSPITEDADGLVTGQGGYTTPLDNDNNNVQDFLETPPPLTFNTQLSDTAVEETNTTSFTFEPSLVTASFTWQESTDNGTTWNDLVDSSIYSGVTTTTLTISSVSLTMNENQYRVIIRNPAFLCDATTISNATLTVTERSDLDADNDGITNILECGGISPCPDLDNDGIPNDQDLDSDGDGCFDTIEAGFTDPDNDGSLGTSPVTEDSDGLVTGQGGYVTPLDSDNNAIDDFLETVNTSFIEELTDLTVNEDESASFTFESDNTNLAIRWEESTDNGTTWNLLTDTDIYTGTTTSTLTINPVSLTQNGNLYRVTISDTLFLCQQTSTSQARLVVLFDLFVPDGFSPNGDGINDTFVIRDLQSFPNYTIQIFNRYGNKVFEGNTNVPNWDGIPTKSFTSNSTVPAGVYFYIINLNQDGIDPIQGRIHLRK